MRAILSTIAGNVLLFLLVFSLTASYSQAHLSYLNGGAAEGRDDA